MYQLTYIGNDLACSQSSLWSVCNFHRHILSEPRPPPPSPGAAARARGPGGAPCCAHRAGGRAEGVAGWRAGRREAWGARAWGRPLLDAPGPGARRELADGLRTLGAGRGGADLLDLAAPPSGAGRGLLTSARGFPAMSHRPEGGGGSGSGSGAGSPPPPRAVVGAPPLPGVPPALHGRQVLSSAVAGMAMGCDRDTEKV